MSTADETKKAPMPHKITIGDKYGPAMKIEDQAEADAYFERLVEHSMLFGNGRDDAEKIERANLGYYAVYYDDVTRERVERLFRCAHPVFGAIKECVTPSAEQALALGRAKALG